MHAPVPGDGDGDGDGDGASVVLDKMNVVG